MARAYICLQDLDITVVKGWKDLDTKVIKFIDGFSHQ